MKKKLLALAITICCVAFVAAMAGCGSSASQSSASSKSESFDISQESSAAPTLYTVNGEVADPSPVGVKTILVIGDDGWEQYKPGHADMMCLLRVDFDNKTITEVSIPRDTRWQFEDGSFGKLNYVYTNGGGGEAGSVAQAKACAEVIGQPIDFYVTVGLEEFQKIVDGMEGVDVDLPYNVEYSFYTNDYPNEWFDAGEQTLDGWRAMVISRTRSGYVESGVTEPDVVRQYTDRMMLTSLMRKGYSNIAGIEAVLSLVQSNVESNIPLEIQVQWAEAMGEAGSIVVKGTTGPYYGDYDPEAGDQWVVLADPEGWSALMASVNANESADDIANTIYANFSVSNFPPEIPAATETTIEVS